MRQLLCLFPFRVLNNSFYSIILSRSDYNMPEDLYAVAGVCQDRYLIALVDCEIDFCLVPIGTGPDASV